MDLDDWETLHRSEAYKHRTGNWCDTCKYAEWGEDKKVVGCEIKERIGTEYCCYDNRLEKRGSR